MLGASLLFLLPTSWPKREFTLVWSDAAKIDWGTIVLFGTGIIFGSLLESSGLAETLGTGASDKLGLSSAFAITVFAAASLTDALKQVAGLWAAQGHAMPRLSFASSSVLAQQVGQGAPADLFVSADEKWMDWLDQKKLLRAGTRSLEVQGG